MDFKQLRSFTAVVECRSFTRAAERLSASQPTVSAHIRALETELHERLFLRTTKSLEITARGRELYDYAVQVLSLRDKLTARWAQDASVIRLGVSTIPSAYILPELLPRYLALRSGIAFDIHQSDSRGVIAGLLDGSFELGLVGMEEPNDAICFLPFYLDKMVLITPNSEHFRNARKQNAGVISLLLREPLLLREEGSGSQRCVDDFFRSAGLSISALRVTARLNDAESVKNLVAGGLGISIISEKAAADYCREGKLLSFPLPNDAGTRSLYIVYRQGDYLKPAALEFMEFAKGFYPLKT